MTGWVKLFGGIVTSSIWCEDDATLRVWIAMLATADSEGVVEGSTPGFANLARVTVEQMRAAVEKLTSPDPDSRTPDHEGRRIEAIEGGWRILNYLKYREKAQEKEGSRAPYYRVYRRRKREQQEQQHAQQPPQQQVLRETQKREERGEKRENSNDNDNSKTGQPSVMPRDERDASRLACRDTASVPVIEAALDRMEGRG